MLRHSLYKKFAKTSFQPGGEKTAEDTSGSPMANPLGIPKVEAPKPIMPPPNFGVSTPDFLSTFAQGNNIITGAPLGTRETTDENGNAISAAPGYVPPASQSKKEETPWDKLKEEGKSNWQDYATLGLAGVSSALNYQDDIRRQQELQSSIQNRGVDAKPINDYNWMYGRTTSGGTEYQPTIMAKNGANINTRYGLNDQTISNVEIEGGEFLILPDGTTEIAKGPSHKKGGIHTILPEGTKVFSNHLKPKDLHKMPAEQKLMLMNKYMQDGGDMSMGLGLDYLEDLKELIKGSKEQKSSDDDAGTRKSTYKDNTRTFAELAKRYDLKQYQELLDNPFTNQVDRQTAELLMRRNQQILDQLFRDQQILNNNSTGEPMAEETQMARGGINNPGFEALPGYVQAKITANMEYGGKVYMQDGAKKYKLPENAVILDEKDQTKANVGDYVRSADGTIKKVTKKNINQVQEGFNTNYDEMAARWNDPKMQPVKDAMYQRYLQSHPGSTVSKDAYMQNYMGAQKQLYDIQAAAAKDPSIDLRNPMWDRTSGGMKNKQYQETAKRLGITPMTEDQAKQFQAGYKDLADLQNDPQYSSLLSDFDLRPKGVGDQMYSGKAISPEDAIVGNTTIGQVQYLKKMRENPELEFENVPEETPEGGDYSVTTVNQGKYERDPFPTSQYIPGAYALAQSQEAFTPAIPEVAAPYVRPQTLNIQSQLQDADNNAIAAMRYGADPNMAYIAGLDSKQKAFQTKQNYDAEGRWKADLYNADAKFKADVYNADAFNTGYNDMYATALGNQSEAKQASVANLVNLRNKYNQDENLKEFYLNTYGPSLDKKQGQNKLDVTPGAASFNWSSSTTTSGKTPTVTTSVGTPSVVNVDPSTLPAPGSPGTSPGWPSGQTPQQPNPNTPMVNRRSLDPNLPLSMQYGPSFQQPTNVNLLTLPESMGGAGAPRPSFEMGGELDNYLNPFKKNKVKGFRKK
jgi:hypothetical protein